MKVTYSGRHGSQAKQSRTNTRESIIDLAPYIDQKVRVKFVGGREVIGTLKGADPICNLVLDDTVEYLRQADDTSQLSD